MKKAREVLISLFRLKQKKMFKIVWSIETGDGHFIIHYNLEPSCVVYTATQESILVLRSPH